MVPRRVVDKGKAPVVEDEPRSTGPVIRSCGAEIVIREAREAERTVDALVQETLMVEEGAKQRVDEAPDSSTVQAWHRRSECPNVIVVCFHFGHVGHRRTEYPLVNIVCF
ncbi:hypothetical protein ACLOJK_038201 [Asimina triloba]